MPPIHDSMKTRLRSYLFSLCGLTLIAATPAHAASATWSGQLNSNWNVSENWSPQTVPNGPSDVATLGSAFNRNVSLSANTEVNGITFPFNRFTAVNYAIAVGPSLTLTISGTGIANNSGQAQNFGNSGTVFFSNSATAGSATFTNNGGGHFGGSSSAGNGAFTNNGGIDV